MRPDGFSSTWSRVGVVFKTGPSCPPHLAAHAHSDLLSFELLHNGLPIISEVGTSIYGSGPDRQFERSSAAHNSLQLASSLHGSLRWIEPVDVWAGFRAGRKANLVSRGCGSHRSWLYAFGGHDGFQAIKAEHCRF